MPEKLLVIDTETGGLDSGANSILSLGAVVWQGGRLIADCEIYVTEPEIKVDPSAVHVNRIDLTWLRKEGLSPQDAINRFHRFLRKHFPPSSTEKIVLVGHNVAFDIGFLKRLYKIGQKSYDTVFSHRVIDTASVIQFLMVTGLLPLSGAGLEEALDYFGIGPVTARHTALGDASATAELFTNLIDLVSERDEGR